MGLAAGGLVLTGSPASATDKRADSCAAYAYLKTDTTICDKFPGSADRDCPDIKGTVHLVNKNSDPWKLDRDKDGVGCEGDPLKQNIGTPPGNDPAPGAGNGSDNGSGTITLAEPKLPVTGSNTAPYVAGAGVLAIGAGVGLFFVMRRREVEFEA